MVMHLKGQEVAHANGQKGMRLYGREVVHMDSQRLRHLNVLRKDHALARSARNTLPRSSGHALVRSRGHALTRSEDRALARLGGDTTPERSGKGVYTVYLLRNFCCARFTNHMHLHFTRIVHIFLDFSCNAIGKTHRSKIIDFFWPDKHTHFTTSIDRI